MSHSSPDVLAVRINLPPEAIIPLAIGVGALLVLIFAGSALASWKDKNPKGASTFGLVMAVLMTGISIYFLTRCLWNQMDPNNEGTGQLQFMDPPIAGFMAACAAAFWKMGEQPRVSLAIGLVIGGLMLVKPWVWPVISDFYGGDGHHYVHARGLLDPEHAEFVGSGIVVLVTGLIAGLSAKAIPPHPPYGAQQR